MARPVQYNIYGKTDVKLVTGPDGLSGEGFFCHQGSRSSGYGAQEQHLAPAICHFLLRYRVYGHHGFTL